MLDGGSTVASAGTSTTTYPIQDHTSYFVGMSLTKAEHAARRLHGRVYVDLRIPSAARPGIVLSETLNPWPVGLIVSTGPLKDPFGALPDALAPPARGECDVVIDLTEDGNAQPLTCRGGHVNVGAWLFYAELRPSLMHLSSHATRSQIVVAICTVRSNHPPGYNIGGVTLPELVSEFELAVAYNDWPYHFPTLDEIGWILSNSSGPAECMRNFSKSSR